MADTAIPNYLRFPLDLGSQSQGHFMKITIYPSKAMGASKNPDSYTLAIFVPGGGNNSLMVWDMSHLYDDVKLARLGMNMIGAVPGVGTAVQAGLGAARIAGQGTINPKVDVLYSNSQLRTFQFDFFMTPTSQEESVQMHQIIRLLRKFSAPEVVGKAPTESFQTYLDTLTSVGGGDLAAQFKTGFWFIPPAEFDIEFKHITDQYAGSTVTGYAATNPYLPKIARSVLTSVIVNYTPGSAEFSTFKDGSPTAAQLTLVFKEMRIIGQDDVDAGY